MISEDLLVNILTIFLIFGIFFGYKELRKLSEKESKKIEELNKELEKVRKKFEK